MVRGRERALHATMVVLAIASTAAAAVTLVSSEPAARVLDAPLLGLPFGVVLVAACPATAWLCRRTLELAGLGGAVQVAPDSAVLAFLLWGGAGAVALTGQGLDGASLLCVCAWAWMAWLAGVCWSETTSRGRRGWVRAFNVGLSATAGAAFLATAVGVRALLGPTGPAAAAGLGPADVLAVAAASAAYVAVDLLLSAVSVALGEDGGLLEALADESTLLAAVSVVVLAALAVLGAVLALGQPWCLLLLAPVVLATTHASQVGARASADRSRSSALYRAAERCQRASSVQEVLDVVVEGAGEVAAAPARLAPLPPGRTRSARSCPASGRPLRTATGGWCAVRAGPGTPSDPRTPSPWRPWRAWVRSPWLASPARSPCESSPRATR